MRARFWPLAAFAVFAFPAAFARPCARLKGFFATINFMKAHKADTDKVAEDVLKFNPALADKAYDAEIGGFIPEGRFDPKAVTVLKRSFVDLGTLPSEPEDSELFTTRFVPVTLKGETAAASPHS